MAPRNWTNGGGTALSAANLNALEAELAAKADTTTVNTGLSGKLDKAAANMANGQDLNTYTTSGTWNVQANGTASGGMNYPVPFSGVLEVIARSDGVSVVQRYTKHATKSVWTRGFYGGTWYPWERMVLEADLSSASFVATPSAAGLMSAADKAKMDTSSATETNNSVAMRDANGNTAFGAVTLNDAPTAAAHATRKDFVDNKSPLSVKDYGAVGDGTTSDQTAITNAIAAAIAQGRGLHWPTGNYVSTDSIANLHTVRHTGPGAIKRGADTFYVAPSGIQTNTLYVATTSASDTYDGLTAARPLRTVKKATGYLFNYGPVLQGFWAIQLAAGTYSDRVKDLAGLDAVAPPTIRGPIVNHPNVPTAMFSEGYNIGAVAIDLSDSKTGFVISNIRFEGYNGTSSSAGVKASATGTETYLINCHFTDNYWGVTCQSSAMDMKGGIFTRNGYLGDTANNVAESSRSGNGAGYRGLMGSRHSIGTQNSGDLLKGPYFINNVSGVFVQETCTGHVDWCRFEDNDFGVNANVNSRANVDGSSFLRNKTALRGIGSCHFFVSSNNVFGTGADENGIPFSLAQGSQMTDSNRLFTDLSQSYNTNLKIVDTVFPSQTVQTTSLTTVYTATLAGYSWRDTIDPNHERKRLVFKVFGSLAGTAGTKSIVLRLGTSNVTATFTATEVGVFEAEATIFFKDVAAQFMYMKASRHLGAGGRFASTQATNALTANTACTVEASVGVATDSVVIDAIDVSWA